MLEMGQDYLTVFHQNKKYQYITAFAIFLIEKGKDKPYFAGKINDITKFQ